MGIDIRQVVLDGKGHNAWTKTYDDAEFRKWLTRQALPAVTYPSDWKDPVRD